MSESCLKINLNQALIVLDTPLTVVISTLNFKQKAQY